jgi:hypothetical protein
MDPDHEPSSTLFGYTVAPLGDINGDGTPDYAVGAPYQDGDFVSTVTGFGFPQNVGKVWVIDGATFTILAEMDDPEFQVIQDRHFGGQIGRSISVSADINGDGVADLIAGVPHRVGNPNDKGVEKFIAGKALIFSGKDGTLLFSLFDPLEQESGRFGISVAALGDVNGDGVADFAVGADGKAIGANPGDDEGTPAIGQAFVFSGKTGLLIRTLDHPGDAYSSAGAHFGAAVANVGDVNLDGVTDLAVGAPGRAQVFVFDGSTGVLLYEIDSPTFDLIRSFGAAISGGQDLNKDGKPDLVVGAPLANSMQGAVYVYNGIDGSLIRTLTAPVVQDYAKFGAAVYASPDVSGNRRPDIIVGAPGKDVNGVPGAGQVYVYDSAKGRLYKTLDSVSPQVDAGFGSSVTSVTFTGSKVATPIVGVPYQDLQEDDIHLQIGQIEIFQ